MNDLYRVAPIRKCRNCGALKPNYLTGNCNGCPKCISMGFICWCKYQVIK